MAGKGTKLNIKTAVRRITYPFGVAYRRTKFAVLGFINTPRKRRMTFADLRRAGKEFISNPKNYITALKIACFLAASCAYLAGVIFITAGISHVPEHMVRESAAGPFASGLVLTEAENSVRLNWTNGITELVDGKAHMKLTAQVTPQFLARLGIKWSSSDTSIAEVTQDGDITAKSPGTVTIRADVGDSGYSAEARLRVLQPVTGLFMTTSNVTLYMGGAGRYLKVRVFPEDATNTNLVWETKNDKIVTVDSAGHIKPVGLGMTEVTAATPDGKYSSRSFVTVVNYAVQVDSVSIENGDSELEVGSTLNLVASVLPYNARNKTLKWSSSDENVVTVNQTGRVKAEGEGSAQITVKSTNGKIAAVNINVIPSETGDGFDLYEGEDFGTPIVVGSGGVTYTAYGINLPMFAQLQMGLSPPPQIWRRGGSVNATEAEVIEYMNPANYCDDTYKYQFLDLSSPNGVSAEALNMYLADKGILAGQGEAFVRAAQRYGISEVYLVAHACLESGNGTSKLSTGVEVNGVTVYNMFGIGAYDYSALSSGSQRAYREGWTSVERAITGGAEWISTYYINSTDGRQNTLYKMLWNPENPGKHQYATDIGWAVKQAQSIASIFDSFPEAVLSFDVPVYSGQTAPVISGE